MRVQLRRTVVATFLGAVLLSVPVAAHAEVIAAEPDDVSAATIAATLLSFGDNVNGQLGVGSTGLGTSTPGSVDSTSLGTGITDVAAGQASSVAVRSDGTVWEWGWDGAIGSVANPTQVKVVQQGVNSVIAQVVGVSRNAYGTSTLAIKSDGTLWSWGDNSEGQLGRGFVGSTGGGAVVGAQDYVTFSMGTAHGTRGQGQRHGVGVGSQRGGATRAWHHGECERYAGQVPGLSNVVAVAAG